MGICNRALWVVVLCFSYSYFFVLETEAAVFNASEITKKVEQVLNKESLEGGASAGANYPSQNLLPAKSLDTSLTIENSIRVTNKILAEEISAVLSGLEAKGPKEACMATLRQIRKGKPLGGLNGPNDRESDAIYFKDNSTTRTCWSNQDSNGNMQMVAELRQSFFIPKKNNNGADSSSALEDVFRWLTVFERSPNTTGETHHYEYVEPLRPVESTLSVSTKGSILESMDYNRNYLIKKCVSVLGTSYCNTILNRAYKIADNVYFLTAQVYNLEKGDATITKDAFENSAPGRIAELRTNSSDRYSSVYVVTDLNDHIAVYSIGIQYKQNSDCPSSFRIGLLRGGHLQEFNALKNMVEGETGFDAKVCKQF